METKKEPLKLLQLQLLQQWASKNSGQVCDSAAQHSFARMLIGDHDFREYMMRKHRLREGGG